METASAPRRGSTYDAGSGLPHRAGPANVNDGDQTLHGVDVGPWRPVLEELRLEPELVQGIAALASECRTSIQAELISSGRVSQDEFFLAVAAVLGVPVLSEIAPDRIVAKDRDCLTLLRDRDSPGLVQYLAPGGQVVLLVSPGENDFSKLVAYLGARPGMRERVRVVAPSVLRAALMKRGSALMLHRVRNRLFDALPYCSARIVTSGPQGFALGALAALFLIALALVPGPAFLALHIFASVFFLACVALRIMALRSAAPPKQGLLGQIDAASMPTYTVLVALRHEADIVPELLVALGRIAWPRSKLEIKLVCEADDPETIEAIKAQPLKDFVEVVEVPAAEPRTKPKALAYALQVARGDFVVLYDAEDRPHPLQLLEAWQRFARSGPDLACVQAPLHITNHARGMIAGMFAFEYSALFRGLLPWLSDADTVLPLGGTSNHFRRSVLDKIGGWDPYNVTEDADLGLRLRRFGYRTETIAYPTSETAPESWSVWTKQRTRWFKGWMQTWLVHMRQPVRLARELGPSSFVVAQIIFAGMVVSALVHPLMLATLAYLVSGLAHGREFGFIDTMLLGIDLTNILFGYLAFFLLGRATLPPDEGRRLVRAALHTPLYWLLLSFAAWRAVFQLLRDPHLWEKTPHPGGIAEDEAPHGPVAGPIPQQAGPGPRI